MGKVAQELPEELRSLGLDSLGNHMRDLEGKPAIEVLKELRKKLLTVAEALDSQIRAMEGRQKHGH